VPLVVFCEYCEAEREPQPGHGLICPECRNVAPTIVQGRDLQLVAVEVPE
jgi:hydrogenase nickel incorporation protein HypA/HybF